MRRITSFLLVLLVGGCWASTAQADYVIHQNVTTVIGISAADGDAAVSFATPVRTEGYNLLSLYVTHTYSAGTAVTMNCYGYVENKTTSFEIQACDGTTAPTLTCGQALWSRTTGTTKRFIFEVPLNYQYVSCTLTVTGGVAADKLTVAGLLGAD